MLIRCSSPCAPLSIRLELLYDHRNPYCRLRHLGVLYHIITLALPLQSTLSRHFDYCGSSSLSSKMAPLPTLTPTATYISSAGHTAVGFPLSRTTPHALGTFLPHLPTYSTYDSLSAATVASPVPTPWANITTSQSIASREGTWQASR